MTLPYFDPVANETPAALVTAAITSGPPSIPPVMSGELKDMVIACDLSRCVYSFINGKPKWRRDYVSTWPRGMDVWGEWVWIAVGSTIEIVHPLYGTLKRVMTLPGGAPGAINSIRVTQSLLGGTNFTWVTVCFDVIGAGSVRTYKLTGTEPANWTLTHFLTNSHTADYPRGAYVDTGWLWVADTFGHRVYAVDLASGGIRLTPNFIPTYFPNQIEFVPGAPDKVLIAEEHGNRILQCTYSSTPYAYSILASAPVAPYNDATKFKSDILALQSGTADPASAYTPKKSKCAVECSGTNTLYSPNSVRRLNSTDLLIADTDNHRVVVMRGGNVVTEVTGFNNPVNAVLL